MRNENQKMKITNSSWISSMFKLLLVAALPVHVWAYKILMIPIPGKSHVAGMAAVAVGLAYRGHKVTFFIEEHYPLDLPELRNRTEISVARYKGAADYEARVENFSKAALESGGDIWQLISSTRLTEWCRNMIDDATLEKLEEAKFDVAVVDSLFFTKFVYLIPHRLQIPWITYADAVDPNLVKAPWLPSFVSNPIWPFSDKMTFIERLENTACLFLFTFILPLYIPDPDHEVLEKFRRYGDFGSLDELQSRSALWLLGTDDVLDYPRPMMPSMVYVGGLTVKRSTGNLPTDIKNFIDGAEKGVILVTFGSMVSSIPPHMVEKFSSAFGRLAGYRVIWRLDNEENTKLSDNVMVSQWLPQSDILAHPSVKLFVTHCGTNSQYEAVYHGVPMIGFPTYGNTFYNARRVDHKGYGMSMSLHDFTADQLLDNVRKILGDNSFRERVAKASEIFRSQAQSPVERATFWIEHVCRFGGDHLRSAGNDLPLYSYFMLDVLAFIVSLLIILICMLYILLSFILNKCCGHKTSINSLKKKE